MDNQEFERLLSPYKDIKDQRVIPRLNFYQKHFNSKRLAAQGASVAILFLSLVIPIVANLDFTARGLSKELSVSVMSLLIALITGLNEVFRWQHLWKEYSERIVKIDTLIGLWEIEVANARQLSDPKEVSTVLGKATQNLVNSVQQTVSTEMETFFRATPRTQSAQGAE